MMAVGYIQIQNHDVARDRVCIVMNETIHQLINKPCSKLMTYVRINSKYITSSKLRGLPKE